MISDIMILVNIFINLSQIGNEWICADPFVQTDQAQDPVREYGKDIYKISNWLYDSVHSVKPKVYPGYRHEIHNYKEICMEVEQGIVPTFSSSSLSARYSSRHIPLSYISVAASTPTYR